MYNLVIQFDKSFINKYLYSIFVVLYFIDKKQKKKED
jgi:hypothetical protein